MTLVERMARFIVDLDLAQVPEPVVAKARACILNGYGIALGSHQTPYAPVAARAVLNMDGEREGASLLLYGRQTTAAGAATANAALFHGRAQEDTCGTSHFGAILLPLITALVESGRAPVERFLPAVIVGYEIGGVLEAGYSATTTSYGLRATPLYGTVAAAAAAAKLMNQSVEQTAAALANAASFAGGVLQSFEDGTDEWRYQVGMAARQGLLAAELAAAGSVSAPHAFEGRSGFVRAFVRTECDVEALAGCLGREWSLPRVTFKPHPVCALNQTPVELALELREQVDPEAIRAVRVYMNPTCVGYAGMDAKGPFNSVSGTLMSIPFCIATTLIHGVPTFASMTDYQNAPVNALIPHIDLIADERFGLLACRIEIDLEGCSDPLCGERLAEPADYSYDQAQVSALIRRIGAETEIPASAYDRLENFVEQLPRAAMADVLSAFESVRKPL